MRNKRLITLLGSICLVLVLAALPFMAACPAPPAEEEAPPPAEEEEEPPAKPTGELRIGVDTLHAETFHPFWQSVPRKFYYEPLYDFLVDMDNEGNLREGLATKWEKAPDHMSWTFWIRDGVKFHDGTPMTLEDVKYSLDEILNPNNIAARQDQLPYQDRVEIVPPDKVVIYLKTPCVFFPYLLSPAAQGGGIILPKKYIEEVGDKFDTHPIGTGPYKFVEQKEKSYIKYEALDYHWRTGTPKYKYLTLYLVPEQVTRVAALRVGELDVITVGRSDAQELEARGFRIVRKAGHIDLSFHFMGNYLPDNPLYKKEVREALVLAIDRAAILEHIFLGQGELIGHTLYMCSNMLGCKEYPIVPYDPKRAKELLAQAGYPDGFTMNLLSAPRIVIAEESVFAEAIAGYWKAVGLDAKVLETDRATISAYLSKKKEVPPGEGMAFVGAWQARVATAWRSMYYSDIKTYLYSQVIDPVMDELIHEFEAQTTLDGYIAAHQACTDRVVEMYYKPGMFSVDELLAIGEGVPEWNLGRGTIYSLRFEYVGASKQ